MSYGQPPSRNAYGDHDFIKEDFNAPMQPFTTSQSPPGSPQPPQVRPNSAYNPNVPYSTPAPQQLTTYNMQQSPLVNPQMLQQQQQLQQQQSQQAGANTFRELLSPTPEDQLFMQSWRRDSFMFRTIPLSIAGGAALFFYNQSKGLPHRPPRYLLVAFGAYMLGRYTYTSELRRRLEANPSNTPFMRKMREILGVKASFSELDGGLAKDYGGFGSSNDLSQPLNLSGGSFARPPGGPQTSPYEQSPNYQPYETDLSLPPVTSDPGGKSMTSYEELRARNRGLI